ncbi:protein unc-50 homolog [Convolutriloba macropyga]|uniref:protein unc-50 homolog n=1 Tax=Convolutriloba macropyga TaxID=536237 RepID=UPI003F5287F7
MFSTASLCPEGGLPSPFYSSSYKRSAAEKRYKFLRRLIKFKQMDFEFAMWQFVYLFISPQKVYRNFQYRYSTKNQYARDDPAFLVLLSICLTVSSVVFSLVLRLGFLGFIKFFLWTVFIDTIGVGMLIATSLWFLSNRYLVMQSRHRGGANSASGFEIEWAYAFDIHLNAIVPVVTILHGVILLLLSVVTHSNVGSVALGNSLWVIALGYYVYITFLGYSSLSILHSTQLLLYPMLPTLFFYCVSLMFGWNYTNWLLSFYSVRIG